MVTTSISQHDFAEKHFKRNFFLGVANGILFNFAWAFTSGSTILPLFISKLTSSSILIGLASTLEAVGWALPQMAVAAVTLHQKNQMPLYIKMAFLRAVAFLLLAILVFFSKAGNPSYLLLTFFFLFSIYAFGGGVSGVSFMEVVGKTIPPNRRGSFFGMRMFFGGGLAALAGILIERVLRTHNFPKNFGIMFLIAAVLIIFALLSFSLVKEPPVGKRPERKKFRENLRLGFETLKMDINFRMLLWIRIAVGSYVLGFPFYIIFAKKFLLIPTSIAGIFLSIQMVGYLSSNLLWGYLSNNKSNKLVLFLSAICSAVCPFLLILSILTKIPVWLYGSIFFFLGATISGLDMGYTNYLLEIAPEEQRPIYVGVLNTIVGPTIFLSAVGGLIIQLTSFAFLYSLVFLISIVSIFLSLSLSETKKPIELMNPY
jgi:MFS family permease